MRKLIFFITAGVTALALNLSAAEPTPSRESVERLLNLSHSEERWSETFKNLKEAFQKGTFLPKVEGVSPEKRDEAIKMQEKVLTILQKEFSWESVKDQTIETYAKVFTADEIEGLTKFYESPAGIAFVNKMPEIMKENMVMTQKKMAEVMPKIQAEIQRAVAELKEKKEKEKAAK